MYEVSQERMDWHWRVIKGEGAMVDLAKSLTPKWREILNFNKEENLKQVSPIAILQIMDIGTLLAYRRLRDPKYVRTLMNDKDDNLYGELAKQIDADIIKIYLETMIRQLEALEDSMEIIRRGLNELLKSTLPYQSRYFTKTIELEVNKSLASYVNRASTYQWYLKLWNRIIPGSVPYVNRTRDFIEASIKLIKDENYYFNESSFFENSGVYSKFIKPGM
jgi:hypothetical protein